MLKSIGAAVPLNISTYVKEPVAASVTSEIYKSVGRIAPGAGVTTSIVAVGTAQVGSVIFNVGGSIPLMVTVKLPSSEQVPDWAYI